MKCNHLIVLLLLTVVANSSLAAGQQDQQQLQQQQQQQAMRLVRLPEMINFERFQQIYNKHYPTLLVKMARARLFAANAFKAFISNINYMWRRSTRYLVVNKWSDSTVEERRKLMNHGGSSQRAPTPMEENLVANVADVERKFNEIVEHKNDNEIYAEIAGELEKDGSRRKRSVPEEQPKRQLSMDDQIRESDDAVGSSPESLPEEEAKEILKEPTNGWFRKIVNSVDDYVRSRATGSDNKDEPTTEESPTRKVIVHSHPNPNKTEDQVLFDYNDSGCLPPIEDQGMCGCCYIMSAMAVLEYNYCKQTEELVPFSKQYVIDCGTELRNRDPEPWVRINGCNGGLEQHVGEFATNYGIIPESKYPYNGTQGECPKLDEYRNSTQLAKIRLEAGNDADWYGLEPSSMTDTMVEEYLEKYGPMTFATCIYDDFFFYGGGVDLMPECYPDGGHAMVLVGYGIEDGIEYWLIRNSHGPEWGVKGHWKLAKSSRECLKSFGFGYPLKFYHT